MSALKSIACDVPECDSRFEAPYDLNKLPAVRKHARERANWGVLTNPDGSELDICPDCMGNIRDPTPATTPDAN